MGSRLTRVTLQLQEFRSRDAKLLCDKLNYNRIECDYVSRRRDREPSRIPAKKLKRLSQKSRKLKVFVGKQILKQIPLSSKLCPYIKCRLKRNQNMKRRKITSVKFVKKSEKKARLLYMYYSSTKIV